MNGHSLAVEKRGKRGVWFGAMGCGYCLLACGQQYRAVEAIGHLGQNLEHHRDTVGAAGANCVAALAYAGNRGDYCSEQIDGDSRWQTAVLALATYSRRLRMLAAEQSIDADTQTTELIDAYGATTSLEADDRATETLNQVVNGLNSQAQRDTLRHLVNDVGPSVDTLARLLSDHLLIQLKLIATTRTSLCAALESDRRLVSNATSNQIEFLATENAADRLAHSHELGRLLLEQHKHERAIRALRSFTRAHQALVRALNASDYDDSQALRNIVAALTTRPTSGDASEEQTTLCPIPKK